MNLYQHVGVAVAFSPRLHALLCEAAFHGLRLGSRLGLIHAGAASEEKRRRLREALREAGLPEDTPIHWAAQGSPDEAILRVVEQQQMDLLLAGALEKERALRYYLGSVAHNLVREAPCSLLLLTDPSAAPAPFRRIVVVTDYSESAVVALAKALRFADDEGAEGVHVVRVRSAYGEAMLLSEGVRRERAERYQARTLAEEEALLADFVVSAGRHEVPVEAHVIEGQTGLVLAQFAREKQADLLVMPSSSRQSHFFERLFPSDMEWVLREIPCNLWVARERLQ
ncbi:MAG TPA: universal stress protein [Anaeromyxobacteraceae bacterium]|nr:universal stress protein [Anaeromyxobacteraceae bacterium]